MSIGAKSGLLCALIVLVGTRPVSGQEAVLLRLDPQVGQVTRHRMESKTWMLPGSGVPTDTAAPTMVLVLYSTQTVAAAEAGVRTISTVIDSSRMELGGGAPPLGQGGDLFKGTTTIRRVNADGELVSSSTVPGPNLPPMMAGRMSAFGEAPGQSSFPKRPLKVGDTWTDSTTRAAGAGQGRAEASVFTLRLERIERRGGSQVAIISVSGSSGVPADSANRSSISGVVSGEMTVDVTHRRMVRLSNEHRTLIDSPSGPRTIFGRMMMTLIEP